MQVEIAKHREDLEQVGLSTIPGAKAFRGELVKNHRGRRDILKISLPDSDGKVLFLKRNWRSYKKDGHIVAASSRRSLVPFAAGMGELKGLGRGRNPHCGTGCLRRGLRAVMGTVFVHNHGRR
jgi:hypothetical protein